LFFRSIAENLELTPRGGLSAWRRLILLLTGTKSVADNQRKSSKIGFDYVPHI
jgi:hypothetical protein